MIIKILMPCELESFFDILASFGAYFKVGQRSLLNFLPNSILRNFPFLRKVNFIAQKNQDGLFFLMVVAEVNPLVEVIEGFLVSYYSPTYW